MTDKKIVEQIKAGKREKAIRLLYQLFPKVTKSILQNGGNEDDAREIFHDSLVLLIEKIEKTDFELTSKLSTYLYSINHFMWRNEVRKRQKSIETKWPDALQVEADDFDYNAESEQRIEMLGQVLNQISDKCKSIISLFYYKKKSMTEIAKELDFSSVNSAKTQKYKCMERAIKLGRELQVTELKTDSL